MFAKNFKYFKKIRKRWIQIGLTLFILSIILLLTFYTYLIIQIYPSFNAVKNYVMVHQSVQTKLESKTLTTSLLPMISGYQTNNHHQAFWFSFQIYGKKTAKIAVFLVEFNGAWLVEQGLRMKDFIDNCRQMFKGHSIFSH